MLSRRPTRGAIKRRRRSGREGFVVNRRGVQRPLGAGIGAKVEQEKQELDRGTYQHLELFGQPGQKGSFGARLHSERPPAHAEDER